MSQTSISDTNEKHQSFDNKKIIITSRSSTEQIYYAYWNTMKRICSIPVLGPIVYLVYLISVAINCKCIKFCLIKMLFFSSLDFVSIKWITKSTPLEMSSSNISINTVLIEIWTKEPINSPISQFHPIYRCKQLRVITLHLLLFELFNILCSGTSN